MRVLYACLLCITVPASVASAQDSGPRTDLSTKRVDNCLRVATFNVSFNRAKPGELKSDIDKGDEQIRLVAAIIRTVKPDIVLLNEVDYSATDDNAASFASKFLADPNPDVLGNAAWSMPYSYSASVNTGEPSGIDLNANGKTTDPEDAWGFGKFPGQYGMAVLSRYPIVKSEVRTFQKLLWSTMPGAMRPQDPQTGKSYYDDDTWKRLRLSSKSMWDVPIETPQGKVSIIASHPTPPAFDGPEDRNGCRNHDEIQLISDYISDSSQAKAYLVDDQGHIGPIAPSRAFFILGDLNSDPIDGESKHEAIARLIAHPNVAQVDAPTSVGAMLMAKQQGQRNEQHTAPHNSDTADFFDGQVGNLRVDYVLPSKAIRVQNSQVFWLAPQDAAINGQTITNELSKKINNASDHHLVWVDASL